MIIIGEINMKNHKNIFLSVTFWGAILSLWMGVSCDIKIIIEYGWSASRLFSLIDNLMVTLMIIIGRYQAKEIIYTPKGFPGRNKPDN